MFKIICLTAIVLGQVLDASVAANMSNVNIPDNWRPKLLITTRDMPDVGLNILKEKCEITYCDTTPATRAEILSKIAGVDGLVWISSVKLNVEMLDAAGPQLKSIATMSVGYDHIDVKEIKARGIPIGNTPSVLNDAVADMAIGLMIAAARRFHEGRLVIDNSKWEKGPQWMLGQDLTSKTFGIVGLGEIGQTIAHRLSGFTKLNQKPKIIYSGNSPKPEAENFGATFVTFDELLQNSDIIFISAPLNNATYKMFNEAAFNKMKPTAVLVNVARGDLVDQEALYDALKNSKIFAAGLDVTSPEPLPADHPLLKLPNFVITPHLGSATLRTRNDMAYLTAVNVLAGLAGSPMLTPIP